MTGTRKFEIGALTFGELTADPVTGKPIDPAVRLREFIDLAKLADEAGLDVFGVGEHHRPDFAIASPAVVLAAVAEATDESFPLFGFDLADYDELFEEKLDLLLRLDRSERVTWSGRHLLLSCTDSRLSTPGTHPTR